jgi:haloalkane dehalogenase
MIDQGDIPTGALVASSAKAPDIRQAYDAPFPEPRYKAGALIMPQRVPMTPDDPAVEANKKAWEVFRAWDKPFLTAFGDSDPITRSMAPIFRQQIPGAKGQPHTVIKGAGHFIQESHGPELAAVIAKFIADNPVNP